MCYNSVKKRYIKDKGKKETQSKCRYEIRGSGIGMKTMVFWDKMMKGEKGYFMMLPIL
jgi:hypothetical protein